MNNKKQVPCVQVGYGLGFWGGESSSVGDFADVPLSLVDACDGSVQEAFRQHASHDPIHVIHDSLDEVVDHNGDWVQEE